VITTSIRPFEPQSTNSHAADVLAGISDCGRSNLVWIFGRDIAIGRANTRPQPYITISYA